MKVHAKPFVVDAQAALASDEGEVAAEFEQKCFEVADKGVLQFSLGIFVAQAEEFEDERVAHGLVGGEDVAGAWLRAFLKHGSLVS